MACLFPRKDLLLNTIFPDEMEEGENYYIPESSIIVDRFSKVYIRKNAQLRLSPIRQWERSHSIANSHGKLHLSLTVPSNWRIGRLYIEDYSKYFEVASILITQTDEVEELY